MTAHHKHIQGLYEHITNGPNYELPKGVVNRLLEAAADGKFTWPVTTTAQQLEDALVAVCLSPDANEETVDYMGAVALYQFGVTVKD